MDRVAFVVAAVGIAVWLFVKAYRCGRRQGDLPLMLERAGCAFIALFVGSLVFADMLGLWIALLMIAVALFAASKVALWREDAAQEQLLVSKGGPTRRGVFPPWLVAVVVGAAVAVPFVAAAFALVRWGENLTRPSDVGQAAVLAGQVQQVALIVTLSLISALVLALIAGGIAWYRQGRRLRSVRQADKDALAFWMAGQTYEEKAEFVTDLENTRLARRFGLAPRLTLDEVEQVWV